jgi:hypothetical protein
MASVRYLSPSLETDTLLPWPIRSSLSGMASGMSVTVLTGWM